ncbi:MAG TPA: hypothetical protein VIY48_11185 [Candidatus Paceibacterota bacterium]
MQTLSPLPPEFLNLGSDPTLLRDEIKLAIQEMMDGNPRSLQTEIGVSEFGTPCTRKLVYKLGNVPTPSRVHGTWPQMVGTMCHSGLADMLDSWNKRLTDIGEYPRFYTEAEVTVGTFGNGRILRGHSDGYDRCTASVLDWKIVGQTTLKKMRRDGNPGQTYEVQVQGYGVGFHNAGLPVRDVHIFALPQGGNLNDMVHWSAPFDPAPVWENLNRIHQLTLAGETMGFAELAALSITRPDYCEYCPWFSPANPDPKKGRCPGSEEIVAQRATSMIPPRPFG